MRWTNLDKLLKNNQPKVRRIYQKVIDECVDSFNLIGLDEIDNLISSKDKRKIENILTEAKEESYYPYLQGVVPQIRTKRQFLLFVINVKLLSTIVSINRISQDICVSVSKESLKNNNIKKPIDFSRLEEMSFVPLLHIPLEEYLFALHLANGERILRNLLSYKFDSKKEVERLTKQMINAENGKHSGVIHDIGVSVANQSTIEFLPNDSKVKFVAIEDDRTTEMCQSLDGQIFYVGKENTFIRYFDSIKGYKEITVNGLVAGINLPPINDHVHRCRSYIVPLP